MSAIPEIEAHLPNLDLKDQQTNSIATDRTENSSRQSTNGLGVSRRSILGKAGLLTTVGVAAPLLAGAAHALPQVNHDDAPNPGRDCSEVYRDDQFDTLHAKELRRRAYKAKIKAAELEYNVDTPPHPNNGDEARYPNKIGTSVKGLKHDAEGHVDPLSYASFLNALKTGKHEDFEKIILGGTAKLADPQGPLSSALEGINNSQLAISGAASLDSAALAAEHIEIYWLALLHDVPLSEYRNDTSHPQLVNNVGFGRNFNGFHTHADTSASPALGETLAITLLRDQRYSYNGPFDPYTFT